MLHAPKCCGCHLVPETRPPAPLLSPPLAYPSYLSCLLRGSEQPEVCAV